MTLKQMIQIVVTRYMQQHFEGVKNGAKLAKITAKKSMEYTVKLLDETGSFDESYKEIIKVRSNVAKTKDEEYKVGETVIVVFLYQDSARPYIIGKYEE